MNKRKPRGKYSRDKIKHRNERHVERQKHIAAVKNNGLEEELPEPLIPDIFKDIEDTYWEILKAIPDPRDPAKIVYPLYKIIHRIISGFIDGNKYIGVMFPKKRRTVEPGKKNLGGLPTRKPVYQLLRRIDWTEANAILKPLWDRLGYTPVLVIGRAFKDPKKILDEFEKKQLVEEQERRKRLAEEAKASEKSKGMSAARAKRPTTAPQIKQNDIQKQAEVVKKTENDNRQNEGDCNSTNKKIKTVHNLVIDGKVVKASYNSGVKERIVHVTEVRVDEEGSRSRFIIGARPTELDRKGEWGAALSVLEALTPLPDDVAIVVSGDAGMCVEKFCEWLTKNGFFSFSR